MNKPPRYCTRAVAFSNESVGDGHTLRGYAAVFDSPTRIDSWEGTFDEVIARGAFKRTLNARTPVLQFDHGMDFRTGSVPIGALDDIHEDDRGLFVKARLHDNQVVEPIRQAIASGAIDGMSFRFRVTDDTLMSAKERGEEVPLRTVREVELFELGPVVFPAYDATTVGVRCLLSHLDADEQQRLITELKISSEPARQGTSGTEAVGPASRHSTGNQEHRKDHERLERRWQLLES